VFNIQSHVMLARVIAVCSTLWMYNLCRPVLPASLLWYIYKSCKTVGTLPPILQTPPICIVMFNATPRKFLNMVFSYFLGFDTGTLAALPTVAPVCMGASGMGTSLKSSWPIALIVYESVAQSQLLALPEIRGGKHIQTPPTKPRRTIPVKMFLMR
jgi:hypothetical protein